MPDDKLGPTGRNAGQLGPHDEGELLAAVTIEQGFIVLRFGKPISWVSLPASDARQLARMLIDRADRLEFDQRRQKAPG